MITVKAHKRKGRIVRSHSRRTVSSFPKVFKPSEMKSNKYYQSNKEGKKLMIKVSKAGKEKLVHFGDKSMSDFTKHKDPKRRKNYLARSGGIKDKSGKLTKNNPFSANYHARRILW